MNDQIYTWAQFAPSFALVIIAAILLMVDAFIPKFPKSGVGLLAGICAILVGLFCFETGELSSFYYLVACISTGFCILMAYDYRRVSSAAVAGAGNEEGSSEFYILPLIASAGVCALVQAHDFVMLFVALEVLTLTSYVLTAYYRRNQGSIEAGIKYFVLGAMSTGILVFGIVWFYGMTGSFVFNDAAAIRETIAASPMNSIGLLFSFVLILLGICFKIGAVPMQTWLADVYQGAPTPVTAYLAIVSKAAGFCALCLITPTFLEVYAGTNGYDIVLMILAGITIATLIVGNLGAIRQSNSKRLIAYSSIAQAGFILCFFASLHIEVSNDLKMANMASAMAALMLNVNTLLYIIAYALATIVALSAIALVRSSRGSEEISAFRGLGKSNPFFAFLVTVSMASLAGVPLTLGFLAKLSAFSSVIDKLRNSYETCEQTATCLLTGTNCALACLLIVMVLAAAMGFYYYFKILRAMYWDKSQEGDKALCFPLVSSIVMSICAILAILLGTLPLITKV